MIVTCLIAYLLYSYCWAVDVERIQVLERAVHAGDFDTAEELFQPAVFPYHTSLLFSRLPEDPEIVRDFIHRLLTNDLLKMLTDEDVMVSNERLCNYYGANIKLVRKSLGKLSETCFTAMAEYTAHPHIKYYPASFVKRHPVAFISELKDINGYSPEQIRAVTSVPAACGLIDPIRLRRVRDRKQWDMFRPICMRYVPNLENANFSIAMTRKAMPADIFSYYGGMIHEACWKHLTAKQIRYYGSECDSYTGALPLNLLNPEAAKGVTSELFEIYVRLSGPGEVTFKEHWRYFPKAVLSQFSGINDFVTLAIKLAPSNYRYMTERQLNMILEYPEACAVLPADIDLTIKQIGKLVLKSKCFANMKPQIQVAILTSGVDLPDNILEHIGSKHLLKMDYSIYTLNKLKGSNRETVIENLSTKIFKGDHHACRLIKNVDVLKNMRIFRLAMPKRCWKYLGFKVKVKHIIKNPKYFAGRPKVLKTLLRNERYVLNLERLSKKDIKRLTAGKAGLECKYMEPYQFRTLLGEQRLGLSPECIANMKFLKELPQEELAFLPPNAFAKIDYKKGEDLDLDYLQNQHLEHISEHVPITKTIGSVLSKDVLENKISAQRLNHLPARVWASVPPTGFTIFRDKDILSRMAGEKMAYWTLDQIKMISKDVLANLNPDQVKLIGELSSEKKELADYLRRVATKFESNTAAVFSERFGGVAFQEASNRSISWHPFSMLGVTLMTAALFTAF